MKQFFLQNETLWVEKVPVILTEDQRRLLITRDDTEKVLRDELLLEMNSNTGITITDVLLIAEFQSKYDECKSKIETECLTENVNIGDYKLISFDIFSDDINGILSGILNCRVNEKHLQVRF